MDGSILYISIAMLQFDLRLLCRYVTKMKAIVERV